MKSFRQYIIEVLSFEENTSFVFAGGKMHFSDESHWEHPDAFPHIYFPGHAHGKEEGSPTGKENYFGAPRRPIADMWGRIDHKNNVFHILSSNHHMNLASEGFDPKTHPKQAEREVDMRLRAAGEIQEIYPDYKIHIGSDGEDSRNNPILISFKEHEKKLNQHLYKHLEPASELVQ